MILHHWKVEETQLLAVRTWLGKPTTIVNAGHVRKSLCGTRFWPCPSFSIPTRAQRYKIIFPNTTQSRFSFHISLFAKNSVHDPHRAGWLKHLLKCLFKTTNLSFGHPAKLTTTSRPDPAPLPCPCFQYQLCYSWDSPYCYQVLLLIIYHFRSADGLLSKYKTWNWLGQ